MKRTLALFGALLASLAATPAADTPAEWRTPCEAANYARTPGYDETLAFLKKLVAFNPRLKLDFFGTTGAGRAMPYVISSSDRAFTPRDAARTGKPVVLIVSGIHAGEIDGKDASLEILRDVALGRAPDVLDAATILWVPIYNIDGHERMSKYNRPNQDGPTDGMGFRTNATGLDLNRDHVKLVSPEARALVALFNDWRPHLHVDNHVTDGSDHDWVLTYAWVEAPQLAAPVDAWMRPHIKAAVAAVEAAGIKAGPYVNLINDEDPSKGFTSFIGAPRLSNPYFALRHRASVLIETHSYKPYAARVGADRALLLALLAEVKRDGAALVAAVEKAEAQEVALGRPDAAASQVVLRWQEDPTPETIRYPSYAYTVEQSDRLGMKLVKYTRGELHAMDVPWLHRPKAAETLARPRGYLVPPGWPQIEERLAAHGLRVLRLTAPVTLAVETQRASEPKFEPKSYQGLTRLSAKIARAVETRTVPAGTLWIPADQPDFEIAVQLLEAGSPDSLFAWGLLSSVLERKEYIDPGVLDRLVAKLLEDPKVAAEWAAAQKDPAFDKGEYGRFYWWYRRTPYWDEQVGLMPAFRVMGPPPAWNAEPWHRATTVIR